MILRTISTEIQKKFKFLKWFSVNCDRTMRKDDHGPVKNNIVKNEHLAHQTLREIVEVSFKTDIAKRILIYGEASDSPKVLKIKEKMALTLDLIDSGVIDGSVIQSNEFAKLFHFIIGASSETGEMAEALAKHMMGKGIDLVNMLEEVGDNGYYIDQLAKVCGGTLESAFTKNVNKLAVRYQGGYSDKKAVNRNTDKERVILEGKV